MESNIDNAEYWANRIAKSIQGLTDKGLTTQKQADQNITKILRSVN